MKKGDSKCDKIQREISDILKKNPKILDSLPLIYREIVKQIRDMDTARRGTRASSRP